MAGCQGHATESRRVIEALNRLDATSKELAVTGAAPSCPAPAKDTVAPAASDPSRGEAIPGPLASTAEEPRLLNEFLFLATRDNPEVRAADESVRTALAVVPQATAPPDPELLTRTLPEPARYADGNNYFILSVMMTLPVPEKLDRAGRVALEEAWMALHDAVKVRREVLAEVKRAYFRLYVLDKTIETSRANRELLRGLIDVAHAEVAAGRRSQEDVLRAQVELYALDSELIEPRSPAT
jgi:cobalt-zinc-cadmium efflux system outer membrane protein